MNIQIAFQQECYIILITNCQWIPNIRIINQVQNEVLLHRTIDKRNKPFSGRQQADRSGSCSCPLDLLRLQSRCLLKITKQEWFTIRSRPLHIWTVKLECKMINRNFAAKRNTNQDVINAAETNQARIRNHKRLAQLLIIPVVLLARLALVASILETTLP